MRDLVAMLLLCAASVAVYLPIAPEPGPHVLAGAERGAADLRRIAFAREALVSPHPHLPAWDARQFTGVPFCADLRNFPWIPNRLALLTLPAALERDVHDIGVALATALTAIFTYAYARRLGLAPLPAALAGWTFAAAQLLARRVVAGELPFVETFCALPLMLWLVERSVQLRPDERGKRAGALLALGLATTCIVLGGDVRLPLVAIVVAMIYALYRAGRGGMRPVLAMLLGIGCAALAGWPMLLLTRRSIDASQGAQPAHPFLQALRQFVVPHDGAAYVGWVPLIALGFVALAWFLRGWPRNRVWGFLVILGAISLGGTAASPIIAPRYVDALLYLPVFTLAIALGVGIQLLMLRFALKRPAALYLGIALLVLLHAADVVWHDRAVVQTARVQPDAKPPAALTLASLSERVGDGRLAIDPQLWEAFDAARQLDDISAAGPRVPARAQRLLANLNGAPLPSSALAAVDGSALSPGALAAAGVRLVLTRRVRSDLLPAGGAGDVRIYRVPDAASRAAFYSDSETRFVPAEELHEQVRRGQVDLRRTLLLPSQADAGAAPSPAPSVAPDQSWAAAVRYRRVRGDQIALSLKSGVSGYVRVIESFDPGWRATVDGQRTPVLAADDAWLAVAVPQGAHEVALRYHTPGAIAGAIASGISIVLLLVVMFVRVGPTDARHTRPAEAGRPL
jgi:hypothetical protein